MSTITVRDFAQIVLRAIKAIGPADIKNYNGEGDLEEEEEDIRRAFNCYLGSRDLSTGYFGLRIDRGCVAHLQIDVKQYDPHRSNSKGQECHYPVFRLYQSSTEHDLAQTRNYIKTMEQTVEIGEMIAGLCHGKSIVSDDKADLAADLESGVYERHCPIGLSQVPTATWLITNEGQRFYRFQPKATRDTPGLWRTVGYLEGYKDGEVNHTQLAEFEFLMRPVDTPKVPHP